MKNEKDIFFYHLPAHIHYGFGGMYVDDVITITKKQTEDRGENLAKARGHIASHAAYYDKKFSTVTVDGTLHVKRIK